MPTRPTSKPEAIHRDRCGMANLLCTGALVLAELTISIPGRTSAPILARPLWLKSPTGVAYIDQGGTTWFVRA